MSEDPIISIATIGDFAVEREGEPLKLPPSRKTRALLAYLALSDRPQRRERLCEIFWDIPDDPRGALRWSLSKIRQILKHGDQDPLSADRNTVELKRDGVLIDAGILARIEDANLAELEIGQLEIAAAVTRGPFLADLSLPRCPDFEAWRVANADRFEILQVRILDTLITRLLDQPERALPHAHALGQLRPDDEATARRISELGDAARRGPIPKDPPTAPLPGSKPIGTVSREAAGSPSAPVPDRPFGLVGIGDSGRQQEIRYCRTSDGVQIAYAGVGEGPPIIRAAHWMSHLQYDWDSPVWNHWMNALSANARLFRYDARGTGLSDREVTNLSFEAMVMDLEAIVDAAGLERFTLLGVSQSCPISVAYAVRHPERISSLILYGGYARGWRNRGNPAEIALRESLSTLIKEGWGRDNPIFRQAFTSLFIPGANRDQLNWFNELQRVTVSPETAYQLQEIFGGVDITRLLPKVSVPTFVLHTDEDCVTPVSAGRELAAGIPGSEFVELKSRNHILLDGEPAFTEFVGHIRRITKQATSSSVAQTSDASRKQISALTAEIVSPWQVLEADNPEKVLSLIDPLLDQAFTTVDRHGGVVTGSDESGFTAVWGAPKSMEDHAYRACRAALELKAAVESGSRGQARMRIGLDTGDAIVRPKRNLPSAGFETIGTVVRQAGQLARSLRRPVVAITAQTREAVGGFMKTTALDAGDSSTFTGNERPYELISENHALSRWHLRSNQGMTRLVGREMEMIILRQAWRRAREGRGQIIGIVADPGVGKSRLSHEFLATEGVLPYTVVEAGALEFDANVSLRVARTMLESLLGLDENSPRSQVTGEISRWLEEFDPERKLEPAFAFLLNVESQDNSLAELDSADRLGLVIDALSGIFQLECRKRPVVLLLEDLHWIDAQSEQVLMNITDGLAGQRLLVIGTFRPEYVHKWGQRSLFQQIRLDPLGRDETEDFLTVLLGNDPSIDHLKPLLAEKSDGTPLFLEEMVRMLQETGRLIGERGAYHAIGKVEDVKIPANVKPVIAARIDRLAPNDQQLLQLASVVGKHVPFPVLRDLSPLPTAEFGKAIARLKEHEFLFELRSYPDIEYTFKHAFTKDVAYSSLVSEDRKRLHARALEVIEYLYRDDPHSPVEKLADHALRAEIWDKAVTYLTEATDRALELTAYAKASRFLEEAATALDHLPRSPEHIALAIDIRGRMRPALDGIGQHEKAIERLREGEELARESGDTSRLCRILLHRSFALSTHGRLGEAIVAAEELALISQENSDRRYEAESAIAASEGHIHRGEAIRVRELLEPFREEFTQDWRLDRFGMFGTRSVFCLGYLAIANALTGELISAQDCVSEAQQIANETARPVDLYALSYHRSFVDIISGPGGGDAYELANVAEDSLKRAPLPHYPRLLSSLGHAHVIGGEFEQAVPILNIAIERADLADMPHISVHARAIRSCAQAQLNGPESQDELNAALEAAIDFQNPWSQILVLCALADVSDVKPAIGYLKDAQKLSAANQFKPAEARIMSAMGDIHANEGDPRAARSYNKAKKLLNELGLSNEVEVINKSLAKLTVKA